LLATNHLAEAEPLMRRASAIDEKSLSPEHPNLAVHLSNLGGLLQTTNRPALKIQWLSSAMSVRREPVPNFD
jgi:Tetratricopeptide repeat